MFETCHQFNVCSPIDNLVQKYVFRYSAICKSLLNMKKNVSLALSGEIKTEILWFLSITSIDVVVPKTMIL